MKLSHIKLHKHRVRKALGDIDALAASMKELGLLQPVVVDADGYLIAGARRLEAARRLGWDEIKTVTASDMDDVLRRLKAERDENVCRQDFTPSEAVAMAELIRPLEETAAKERREKTQGRPKKTGAKFTPVSEKAKSGDKTAAAVGLSRPTLEKARAVVQAAHQEPEKFSFALDLMDNTGKVSKAYQAVKLIQKREDALTSAAATFGKTYRLFAGDIQNHQDFDIAPDSVDAIIVDPPYPENALPLYTPLAELAARVLKPGALLVAMTGHYTLPEAIERLSAHLKYWWIAAYQTPRSEARVFSRKALIGWKPILVFSKGDYSGAWFKDVCVSPAPDKSAHDWGQSEAGLASMIESFTQPGMTILDPFCGGGSTGVASVRLGRTFIGVDIDEANIKLTAQRLEVL